MIFPKKLNLITASLIKTTDIRLFALRTVQRTNSLCQFFYFPLLGVVPIGIFKEVKGYKFSIFINEQIVLINFPPSCINYLNERCRIFLQP